MQTQQSVSASAAPSPMRLAKAWAIYITCMVLMVACMGLTVIYGRWLWGVLVWMLYLAIAFVMRRVVLYALIQEHPVYSRMADFSNDERHTLPLWPLFYPAHVLLFWPVLYPVLLLGLAVIEYANKYIESGRTT